MEFKKKCTTKIEGHLEYKQQKGCLEKSFLSDKQHTNLGFL